MYRKILPVILVVVLSVCPVSAYGPEGHGAVGAVADEILSSDDNKVVAQTLATLLDGMKLADAALLPDKIKDWDSLPEDQHNLVGVPDPIVKDLREFWIANKDRENGGEVRHHVFHYTDIAVEGDLKYGLQKRGARKTDVVQMITFCIDVLSGKNKEDNEFKITDKVAVILLAHYLGDIHQPLHVGAEYFDSTGKPADPDKPENVGVQSDQGGNLLSLTVKPNHRFFKKLHTFWDDQSVVQAFGDKVHPEEIHRMATQTPPDFVAPQGDPRTWSEEWANEILPLAQEAHRRLQFVQVKPGTHGQIRSGGGIETNENGGYLEWSGDVARKEIHKAGWRLAALFKGVLAK